MNAACDTRASGESCIQRSPSSAEAVKEDDCIVCGLMPASAAYSGCCTPHCEADAKRCESLEEARCRAS